MLMCEVKITKEQFDYLQSVWHNDNKKIPYIEKILKDRYKCANDVTFITYKDSHYYYLVFEGEEKSSSKIKPSSILDKKIKD